MAGRLIKQNKYSQIDKFSEIISELSKQVANLAEGKDVNFKGLDYDFKPQPFSREDAKTGGLGERLDRLIRLKEVLEIVPVSKSTWWSWVAEGKAVQPIRLGRCTCWKYSEILAFTAKKVL